MSLRKAVHSLGWLAGMIMANDSLDKEEKQ
jgi:hypothetical protein